MSPDSLGALRRLYTEMSEAKEGQGEAATAAPSHVSPIVLDGTVSPSLLWFVCVACRPLFVLLRELGRTERACLGVFPSHHLVSLPLPPLQVEVKVTSWERRTDSDSEWVVFQVQTMYVPVQKPANGLSLSLLVCTCVGAGCGRCGGVLWQGSMWGAAGRPRCDHGCLLPVPACCN